MTVSVSVEGVSKSFRLVHQRSNTIKERIVHGRGSSSEELWALTDVTLAVERGEALGLLGHNGSGKSTLLRCVAGILRPTKGRIRIAGRVAALLALGSGFHPELTGRQNVYLNASILGLTKAEVARRFDAIVGFSELEQFIDIQVKQYSSGMYARLAFAVAVSVEPDVLIVDEVLAVGDEAFQQKCIERIFEFKREGRTIILVSHAAALVSEMCDRAVVLDHGHLVADTDVEGGIRALRRALRGTPDVADHGELRSSPDPQFGGVTFCYPNERSHLQPGEALEVLVEVIAEAAMTDVIVGLEVLDLRGNQLLVTNTDVLGSELHLLPGCTTVTFRFAAMPLLDGSYQLLLSLVSRDGGTEYDYRDGLDRFEVVNPTYSGGLVLFPLEVEIEAARQERRAADG